MNIATLRDKGSATHQEDMLFVKLIEGSSDTIIVGVVDGVSGLHLPEHGPTLFSGKTGGYVAAKTLIQALDGPFTETLETLVLTANDLLRKLCRQYKIHPSNTEFMPGAAFAVAKIDRARITVIQAADCLAVWETADGRTHATPRQNYSIERMLSEKIAELMEKHGGNRNEMWRELAPIVAQVRRQYVNAPDGYALLNGQKELLLRWQRIILPRDDVRKLVLCSDGILPLEKTSSEQEIADAFFANPALRLSDVLRKTRMTEEKRKAISHVNRAEATAIYIEL